MHEHNGFMFEDQAGYHGEDRCKNVRRREKKLNCVKSPPSTYSPIPEKYFHSIVHDKTFFTTNFCDSVKIL